MLTTYQMGLDYNRVFLCSIMADRANISQEKTLCLLFGKSPSPSLALIAVLLGCYKLHVLCGDQKSVVVVLHLTLIINHGLYTFLKGKMTRYCRRGFGLCEYFETSDSEVNYGKPLVKTNFLNYKSGRKSRNLT